MSNQYQSGGKTASGPAGAFTPVNARLLPRKCACGGSLGVTRECEECSDKKLAVQRSSSGTPGPFHAPPRVYGASRSPGHQLNDATRALMEPRFGHEFSHLR